MHDREEMVNEFENLTRVAMPFHEMVEHRQALLYVEWDELDVELIHIANLAWKEYQPTTEDMAKVLKELCDLQYVLSGTILRLGFNKVFDQAFRRVHENNMSKLKNGIKYNENGKVTKPDDYVPVNLEDLVEERVRA